MRGSPQMSSAKVTHCNYESTHEISRIGLYNNTIQYDKILGQSNEGSLLKQIHQNSKLLVTQARRMKFSG